MLMISISNVLVLVCIPLSELQLWRGCINLGVENDENEAVQLWVHHEMRRQDCLEKTIMLGKVEGSWMHYLKEWMDAKVHLLVFRL